MDAALDKPIKIGSGSGDGFDTIKDYAGSKGRQIYYYVWALIDGKLFVDGAFETAERAYALGYEKIKQYFEVITLNTKDMNKATQVIRHSYLEQSGNMEAVTQRAKHKI